MRPSGLGDSPSSQHSHGRDGWAELTPQHRHGDRQPAEHNPNSPPQAVCHVPHVPAPAWSPWASPSENNPQRQGQTHTLAPASPAANKRQMPTKPKLCRVLSVGFVCGPGLHRADQALGMRGPHTPSCGLGGKAGRPWVPRAGVQGCWLQDLQAAAAVPSPHHGCQRGCGTPCAPLLLPLEPCPGGDRAPLAEQGQGRAGLLSLARVHVGCWQGTSRSTGGPSREVAAMPRAVAKLSLPSHAPRTA